MSVQAQWNLDNTVDSTLSVARGIFLAAQRDNVQPLAIVSCERFGNTIAMCAETCSKVESLTAKTSMPIAIRFLKGYVGFDASDSATQLSRSQAGIQFLGLAAALVNSMEGFEAAKGLHIMLCASTSDKTLLPTVKQLKDLLLAIKPRLERSGFMNSVIGWHAALHSPVANWNSHGRLHEMPPTCPGATTLNSLVESYRMLSRIGNTDVCRIEIRTDFYASWIIAFTKWCLGVPPSVELQNGTTIFEQPSSKVSLVFDEGSLSIDILVIRTVGSPEKLIWSSTRCVSTGMVSIDSFGQSVLLEYNLHRLGAINVLCASIPCAIARLVHNLRFSKYRVYDPAHNGPAWIEEQYKDGPQLDDDIVSLGLIAFPEDNLIGQVMSRYLNLPQIADSQIAKELPVLQIPAIVQYLQELEKDCGCQVCDTTHNNSFMLCLKDKFIEGFVMICTDILAISLLSSCDSPLLYNRRRKSDTPLLRSVRHALSTSACAYSAPSNLLEHALSLVGHEFSDEWVMSSANGQVVFPTIFESRHYNKRGFLNLTCLPGTLKHDGNEYSNFLARINGIGPGKALNMKPDSEQFLAPVTIPKLLVHPVDIAWLALTGDNILRVWIGSVSYKSVFNRVQSRVDRILEVLSSALMLETCTHGPNDPLQNSEALCAYTTPLWPDPVEQPERNGIQVHGVIAVDGSEELRFLTLAAVEPLVLRKQACISCCLDICRRSRYPYLGL